MFKSGISEFLTMVFSKIFDMASIKFPGTNYPIWGIFLGATFTLFLISFLFRIVGSTSIGSIRGAYSSGGNNSRIRINKERSRDTK